MRGTIQVKDPNGAPGAPPKTFTFDVVFAPTCKQVDVYNQVARPIVEKVLSGYNGKEIILTKIVRILISFSI